MTSPLLRFELEGAVAAGGCGGGGVVAAGCCGGGGGVAAGGGGGWCVLGATVVVLVLAVGATVEKSWRVGVRAQRLGGACWGLP